MVLAVQEYCGPLISVNSSDETLGHTEDYYFPINFSVLLRYFPFLNYSLDYNIITLISHLFLIPQLFSQIFLSYFSFLKYLRSEKISDY